ncbi:ComEC/Rec2 family competence protein [Bdellovibrio sp. HCB-162]|uniref:ComEC/Rec2 family competence protein n=1 Tax=Bdellovibrio sp. HCB-162 TaxID=3394234 RepID=UPI0039BD7633
MSLWNVLISFVILLSLSGCVTKPPKTTEVVEQAPPLSMFETPPPQESEEGSIDKLKKAAAGPKKTVVTVLNVGQGSCSILSCSNGDKVIYDCGSSSSVKGTRPNNTDLRDVLYEALGTPDASKSKPAKINAIVVSHADADHYNLMPELISELSFFVGKIYIGGASHLYSNDFNNWTKKLKTSKTGKAPEVVELDQKYFELNKIPALGCGDASNAWNGLYILTANQDPPPPPPPPGVPPPTEKNKNRQSIVMYLYRTVSGLGKVFSVMFMGDAEKSAEREILKNFATWTPWLQSTVLIGTHHGSSSGTNSVKWVDTISPKVLAFSAGDNKGYGHPRCEVADDFAASPTSRLVALSKTHNFRCWDTAGGGFTVRKGIVDATFNTFSDGHLKFETDGTSWWIKTKDSSISKPACPTPAGKPKSCWCQPDQCWTEMFKE